MSEPLSNEQLRDFIGASQERQVIKWLNENRVNWWKDAQKRAITTTFERATAWFVARRTSLIPQCLTPCLYGENSRNPAKYSITCGILR